MTVLKNEDQLRHIRIDSLTQKVRDLLSSRTNARVSVEDELSSKIKHHAGVIVELRDEQIIKLVVLLNQLFTSYVRNDTGRGSEAAKICTMITKKNPEFIDKVSYLDDPEEIAQQRIQSSTTYLKLFRRESQLRASVVDDFSKCLDFELLQTDLDRSEYVLKLPMFFTSKKNIENFNKLNELLSAISDSITTQNDMITRLLENAMTVLSRGESIPLADRIDLSKAKFVSMGVTVEPTIVNTINRVWYGNNLSTTIENMGDDIQQTFREPQSLILRREDLVEGSFMSAMALMSSDGFADSVRTAQTTAKALTDKIQIISDQLTRFSERIQTLPSKETDGYYNYAIEDIARLISSYSSLLYHVLQFVYDYVEGLKEGVDNIMDLSENLKTHQRAAYQYMDLRKEKKWV